MPPTPDPKATRFEGTKCVFLWGQYFDWEKAAALIKEHDPAMVLAGLDGDWRHSVGLIYLREEGPISSWDYGGDIPCLTSTHDFPAVRLQGDVVHRVYLEGNVIAEASATWTDQALITLSTMEQHSWALPLQQSLNSQQPLPVDK